MSSSSFLYNPITGVLDRSLASSSKNQAFTPSQTVATTGPLTASYNNGSSGVGATLTNSGSQAALVIDGVTLTVGQSVLVKDQSAQAQNGLYNVTATGDGSHNWILTRAVNYDVASDVIAGQLVPIESGTHNANTLWIENNTVTTMGTDPIVFTQFSSPAFNTVQYATLVGGANNTIGNIGPSSTPGQVYVSGGPAANPNFVSPTAGPGLAVTSNSSTLQYFMPMTDKAISFLAVNENSYFITAAATATLPASPVQGTLVTIVCDTTGSVVVQANTGQSIRIGMDVSILGGTATNLSQGDVIMLRYRASNSTWISVSTEGNWTIN
jgi:hypothetical protein